MEHNQNQIRMREELFSMINKHFGGENDRLGFLLKELGKPVSVRTIQSWLIEPNKRSSRKVPDWVLPLLKSYLAEHKSHAINPHRTSQWPYGYSANIINQKAVEMAEQRIAEHQLIREKWRTANFAKFVDRVIDLELRVEEEARNYGMLCDSLRESLGRSNDFEEFKRVFSETRDAFFKVDIEVKNTCKIIENHKEEFSDDHGLLKN